MWALQCRVAAHPIQTLRLQDTKSVTADVPGEADQNGVRWGYREFAAVMMKDWDTRHFPFDHHTLAIRIAETIYDADTLAYVPDGIGSHIDPRIKSPGGGSPECGRRRTPSTTRRASAIPIRARRTPIGPRRGCSSTCSRTGFGIFFKIIMVAYIAFSLVMLRS